MQAIKLGLCPGCPQNTRGGTTPAKLLDYREKKVHIVVIGVVQPEKTRRIASKRIKLSISHPALV